MVERCGFLHNADGYVVPPWDFDKAPAWIRERVEAAGIPLDEVYALSWSMGALGEPYIAKIDLGYYSDG